MTDTPNTYLRLSYGTSRGADTYGYTIVRLADETTGRRFRCMGGGYDMQGTVLADWACATHQDRLRQLADRSYYVTGAGAGYRQRETTGTDDRFYGMVTYYREDGAVDRVSIDGACGQSSVERILAAVGIRLARTWNRNGNTTGWMVTVDSAQVSA